ncbi:DUF4202 domain-containing protein [Sphingobacterium oryzagri]|uniref:DUF4202 domain-containing protein n=1 Tax=Sphingobacterium oryzagri TaxID=3025669 RepID=A0ABY7WNF5_9SPHI|nr:DUF4202 domain-containing protein [Sphingobacterium sp. KACC 22765]WDF70074.1 DUF4202 domain-containing protein [Sphingobacterium sp. KACC 22765]
MSSKLQAAFQLFDAYNQQDPTVFCWEGTNYPQAYFFAQKLYEWVLKLDPNADEALLLASRSQHIGRWESPREDYPMTKEGYLHWRKNLAVHHAEVCKKILEELNYAPDLIDDVLQIIQKKKIKVNSVVQTMENALCLVFLAYQYEDFFPKHREKIVNILKKSLLKMDARGHEFALSLSYSSEGLAYIKEAVKQLTEKKNTNPTDR